MAGLFQKKITTNIIITLGGIIVLITGLIFLRVSISKNLINIQDTRQLLLINSRASETAAILGKEWEKAKRAQSFLQNILPSSDQLINLPRELNFLSQENGVGSNFSFGPQSPGGENQPSSIGFRLTVNGSYQNITRFLRALENSRYFIRHDFIDLSQSDSQTSGVLTSRVFSR